jgi:AraC-like DNA-binding protein
MGVNRLFQHFDFSHAPYLWSYRQQSLGGSGFQGYYHWHQGCEFLYVHEGEGHVFVERQSHVVQRGMLFCFQPFQLHNVRVHLESSDARYMRTILHCDPVALEPFLRPYAELHRLFLSLWKGRSPVQAFDLSDQTVYIEGIIDAAERSYRHDARPAAAIETSAIYLLQLIGAIRGLTGTEAVLDGGQRSARYSEAIMEWLEQNYAEPFDLSRLAAELHLSNAYVSRVFRQETGSSITDYLMARRIKEACRHLQISMLPIEAIGAKVGLPNPSYFVQLFKRVVGLTPRRYREEVQQR